MGEIETAPTPTPQTQAEAADFLRQSREAHLAFHTARTYLGNGRWNQATKEDLRNAIVKARALRQAAHDADPSHRAPAWKDDKVAHLELMAFYDLYLQTH